MFVAIEKELRVLVIAVLASVSVAYSAMGQGHNENEVVIPSFVTKRILPNLGKEVADALAALDISERRVTEAQLGIRGFLIQQMRASEDEDIDVTSLPFPKEMKSSAEHVVSRLSDLKSRANKTLRNPMPHYIYVIVSQELPAIDGNTVVEQVHERAVEAVPQDAEGFLNAVTSPYVVSKSRIREIARGSPILDTERIWKFALDKTDIKSGDNLMHELKDFFAEHPPRITITILWREMKAGVTEELVPSVLTQATLGLTARGWEISQ